MLIENIFIFLSSVIPLWKIKVTCKLLDKYVSVDAFALKYFEYDCCKTRKRHQLNVKIANLRYQWAFIHEDWGYEQ